jgi:purine-binding chemotaxis protein CheW
MNHHHVVLRAGERVLALSMESVIEVFRMVAMAAKLPRAPRHCLGVVDCRGRLVPIFDLSARLGVRPPRSVEQLVDGHVLVVSDPCGEVGYAVDEVCELSEEPLEDLPAAGSPATGGLALAAVRSSDGQVAPVLAASSLLTVLARHQLRAALEALARDKEAAP